MVYLITADAAGNVLELFDEANGNAPLDAVPVTDEQGALLRRGFSGYKYIAGEVVKSIDTEITKSVAKTYADVDAVYAAAVGNRSPEYEQAEQAALAFKAAGYIGTASPYVADYALASGITDQESADIIIARATGLRAAAQLMRSTRFSAQAAMRAATTQADLDAAVAAWTAFIAQVRISLGV